MKPVGVVLAAAVLSGACQGTTTHTFRTGPPRAPAADDDVRLSVVEPEGGDPLGIIQAYRCGAASVEEVLPEFRRAVARAGGNYAKIDAIGVKFEETEETRTESYECGTVDKPRTCTDTHTDTVEVATLQVVGRAFRVARAGP